jgi:PAS domain S-box-containing protein
MDKPLKVLVVEDVEDDAQLTLRHLRDSGLAYESLRVESLQQLEDALREREWDVVLSDYGLPGFNGMAALQVVRKHSADLPFILISGTIGEETAVELIKAGAQDFMMKDRLARLATVVEREIHQAAARREKRQAEEEVCALNEELTSVNESLRTANEELISTNEELESAYCDLERAHADLKESEHSYRSLIENLPQCIFVKDVNCVYVNCNKNYASELGLTPKQLVGKTDFDFFPRELAEKYRADDQRVMAEGRTVEIEEHYIKDGQVLWVQTVKTPVRDAARDVIGIQGIFWDISERKRAEEALRASEARFKSIFDDVTDGLLLADPVTQSLAMANRAMCEMLGYSEEELLGLGIKDIHPEADLAAVEKAVSMQMRGELRVAQDIPFIRKDGTVFYADVNSAPVTINGRELLMGCMRDVTEKRAFQAMALQADRLACMGMLAAGVAHEINNPVGYITSNLETLTRYVAAFKELLAEFGELEGLVRGAAPTGAAEVLGRIAALRQKHDIEYVCNDVDQLLAESSDGARRVRDIVMDLRLFARSDDQEVLARCDVNECLETSLRIAANELKYKCKVHKELQPLPAVLGCPDRLTQVFMNLLINAAQAIPERGEITVSSTRDGSFVEVRVSDDGRGIAPEHLPRLFEPFFTTKEPGKGTGLGLAISRSIIHRHGGSIDVESQLGHGTTFVIRLPVQEQGAAASQEVGDGAA